MAHPFDSNRMEITVSGNSREIINLVFSLEEDSELSELQLEIEALSSYEEQISSDISELMDELNEINSLLGKTDTELKNAGEVLEYIARSIFEDNITEQILEMLLKEDDDQLKRTQLEIAKLQDDNDILLARLAESESSVSGDLEEKIQELMLQIQVIQEKNESMEILNCQKVDEVKMLTQTVLGLERVFSGGEGEFHEIDKKVHF